MHTCAPVIQAGLEPTAMKLTHAAAPLVRMVALVFLLEVDTHAHALINSPDPTVKDLSRVRFASYLELTLQNVVLIS